MNLKKNMGEKDRMIRLVAGVLLLLWGILAHNGIAFIGILLLATAYFRVCPSYSALGMNTLSEDDTKKDSPTN